MHDELAVWRNIREKKRIELLQMRTEHFPPLQHIKNI